MMMKRMIFQNSLDDGATGGIRTLEVKHHWISNPAQWPGYATAATYRPPVGAA